MRAIRSWFGLLGTVALAGLTASAGAQPVGSEFQVNTYTTFTQRTFSASGGNLVAADASGNVVLVWHGVGHQDGSGVFGQRHDRAGEPLGSEFRVNSFTSDSQTNPSVAAAADGDFVVVWRSRNQDGSRDGIFGQRYDSAGVPVGVEFRVNSYTTLNQQGPSVASDANGNFVVVWYGQGQDDSVGIFGQRYDSAGSPLGGEFRVNSYTTNFESYPSVTSDPSGNFVVVWERLDGDSIGVFGQRYDNSGEAQGGEFRVNSYTTGPQDSASVASDASGNFVVVWQSGLSQDGNGAGIFGQRFDSAGVARGNEFQVNSFTAGNQRTPSVASEASGNFVVAWESYDSSLEGISGQRYDSAGVAQGVEFQINSFTTGQQRFPTLGATGANQFVVAWTSDGQDGSGDGVFGQRLDFSEMSTIHMGDLDRKAKVIVAANWRAHVKSLVHDDEHVPVSGALVTLDVAGIGTRFCTTTAAGNCEVTVVVPDSVPSLTFTVTGLNKPGFDYDAGANHDPDPDSDGTVIVVNRP